MSKPAISTDIIEIFSPSLVPITIKHGLGRQLAGWQVIWSDADIRFYVDDPDLDTSTEITLVPSTTGAVRIVLL